MRHLKQFWQIVTNKNIHAFAFWVLIAMYFLMFILKLNGYLL